MNQIPISQSEWLVMEVLWDSFPATSQDVILQLGNAPQWKPQTVKTLLGRLVAKKALSTEKIGNRYLYSPTVSREEAVAQETTSFLDRVSPGSILPLLAHSIESDRQLSADEIDALRKLLERQEDSE